MLFPFGIRNLCLGRERSRKLYLFLSWSIKQIAVIVKEYSFVNYVQNFIKHPAVKGNSICRGNYWVSPVLI